jgi:hypothetical protein
VSERERLERDFPHDSHCARSVSETCVVKLPQAVVSIANPITNIVCILNVIFPPLVFCVHTAFTLASNPLDHQQHDERPSGANGAA